MANNNDYDYSWKPADATHVPAAFPPAYVPPSLNALPNKDGGHGSLDQVPEGILGWKRIKNSDSNFWELVPEDKQGRLLDVAKQLGPKAMVQAAERAYGIKGLTPNQPYLPYGGVASFGKGVGERMPFAGTFKRHMPEMYPDVVNGSPIAEMAGGLTGEAAKQAYIYALTGGLGNVFGGAVGTALKGGVAGGLSQAVIDPVDTDNLKDAALAATIEGGAGAMGHAAADVFKTVKNVPGGVFDDITNDARKVKDAFTAGPDAAKGGAGEATRSLASGEQDTYVDAMLDAMGNHPNSHQVTFPSREDVAGYIDEGGSVLMSPDGKAGVVVKPTGELAHLFNASDGSSLSKARVATLIDEAVDRGAYWAESFDTYLPGYYGRFGFKPVSKLKFNREYAPEGWPYERYQQYNNGEPDVLFYARDGVKRSRDQITDITRKLKYVDEYDEGAAMAAAQGRQTVVTDIADRFNDFTPNEAVTLSTMGYNPTVLKELWQNMRKGATEYGKLSREGSAAWNRVIDKGAEQLNKVVPGIVQRAWHGFFYGNTPDGVRQILKNRRTNIGLGNEEATQWASRINAEVPQSLHKEFYRALDPGALGRTGRFPKEYDKLFFEANSRLDALGRESVELGLLTPETYLKNQYQYAHRYYRAWEDSKSWFNMLRGRMARRLGIKGGSFKKRTLTTVDERKTRGLIDQPSYVVGRTVADLTFDLETAKAFRRIAQNPEWKKDIGFFRGGAEARDAGFIQIPKNKRYGDLSNTWVQKDVANEVFALIPDRGDGAWAALSELYDMALSTWKMGKTAYSPATHGRNVLSNIIMADVGAGLSPTRVDIYAAALKDYLKKGKVYQEARQTGMFGTDFYGAELSFGYSPVDLKEVKSIFQVMSSAIGRSKAGKAAALPGKLYQGEEHWFKMAVYMHQRELGASIADAAKHAEKYLFDYGDLAPFAKRWKRSPFGGPFMSWTHKAAPIMLESAIRRPVRFWKYPAMFKALHEGAKSHFGISDAEWDKYVEAMPDWRRNGVNIMVGMDNGKPVMLDLTYNLPWGMMTENSSTLKHIPGIKDAPWYVPTGAIDAYALSNPFTNTAAEVVFNRNRFLDKPIYDSGVDDKIPGDVLPTSMATEKIASHVYKQMAPGVALAVPPVVDAIRGKPTSYGEKRGVLTTALNKLAGIKLSTIDGDRDVRMRVSEIKRIVRKMSNRLRLSAIKVSSGGMSQEEADLEIEKFNARAEELQAEAESLMERPAKRGAKEAKPKKRVPDSDTSWR